MGDIGRIIPVLPDVKPVKSVCKGCWRDSGSGSDFMFDDNWDYGKLLCAVEQTTLTAANGVPRTCTKIMETTVMGQDH
jgi:hypothetical protein